MILSRYLSLPETLFPALHLDTALKELLRELYIGRIYLRACQVPRINPIFAGLLVIL